MSEVGRRGVEGGGKKGWIILLSQKPERDSVKGEREKKYGGERVQYYSRKGGLN